jgi:hypothetical protein
MGKVIIVEHVVPKPKSVARANLNIDAIQDLVIVEWIFRIVRNVNGP